MQGGNIGTPLKAWVFSPKELARGQESFFLTPCFKRGVLTGLYFFVIISLQAKVFYFQYTCTKVSITLICFDCFTELLMVNIKFNTGLP